MTENEKKLEEIAIQKAADFSENERSQAAYRCGYLDGCAKIREEVEALVVPLLDMIKAGGDPEAVESLINWLKD